METVSIHQSILVPAKANQIYEIMMHADKHADLTSDDAIIEDTVGSAFSFFSGYITGTNVELIYGKRIVQLWQAKEEVWPTTHFSIVIFDLIEQGNSTLIEFTQEELPKQLEKSIYDGWYDYYWNPMLELFADMNL